MNATDTMFALVEDVRFAANNNISVSRNDIFSLSVAIGKVVFDKMPIPAAIGEMLNSINHGNHLLAVFLARRFKKYRKEDIT
jgi:hypothetical protein